MYRILISATKAEQIKVERQFHAGNHASDSAWITTEKYMTADLAKLPQRSENWMRTFAPIAPDETIDVDPLWGGPAVIKDETVHTSGFVQEVKMDYKHNESKLITSDNYPPDAYDDDPEKVLPSAH